MIVVTRRSALSLGYVCAAVAFAGCTNAPATVAQSQTVKVTDAAVGPAPAGTNTVLVAEIENSGERPITVRAATTAAASSIRPSRMVSGPAETRASEPVTEGFTVAPHSTLRLSADGEQLTLYRVTTAIAESSPHRVALIFDDGSSVTFTAIARKLS